MPSIQNIEAVKLIDARLSDLFYKMKDLKQQIAEYQKKLTVLQNEYNDLVKSRQLL